LGAQKDRSSCCARQLGVIFFFETRGRATALSPVLKKENALICRRSPRYQNFCFVGRPLIAMSDGGASALYRPTQVSNSVVGRHSVAFADIE
jgi:hypothetical protein